MRKPVQIAILEGNALQSEILYALCDDGTIWRLINFSGRSPGDQLREPQWEQVREIPAGNSTRQPKE
jgi:hypothetical protein